MNDDLIRRGELESVERRTTMNGSGCNNCPVKPCETMTYRGSACEEQRAKFGLGDPQTNADRIRAMSDRELAHFMAERNVNESTLLLLNRDHGLTCTEIEALKHRIYCSYMQWLKQPAED